MCDFILGFNTAKGDLVRSILFPKPMGFQFYTDSIRFIGFLFFVAFIGMIYGTVILRTKGVCVCFLLNLFCGES